MTRHLRSALTIANRAFDTVCGLFLLLGVFAFLNLGRMPTGSDDFLSARLTIKNIVMLTVFLYIWNGTFARAGIHSSPSRLTMRRQAARIVGATTVGSIPLLLFPLTSIRGAFSMRVVLAFWVAVTVVELIGRSIITLLARMLARSSTGSVRAIIVGSGPRALRLARHIQHEGLSQYRLLGFMDEPGTHDVAEEVRARLLGTLDDLEPYLARNGVDEVLITLPLRSCYPEVQRVIDLCERMGIETHYLSDVFALARAKSTQDSAAGVPAVRLTHVVEDYRLLIKRGIDVVGAACGLIVLSPVLLGCALLVRLSGPGPVVFSQMRYGYNRRQFRMFKFRSMVANAEALMKDLESKNEAAGPLFKIRQDPRITPIGRILRKTSLDELPQLFNVLIGDMSLVGPRPLSLRDTYRLSEPRMLRRFSVRPGLTCLWQVSGRSDATSEQFAQLDLAYIDNWSLALDARILLKTVPVVITGAGAA